ncbi:MAG: Hsp33 family molecular chaperone HslO, partial [Flammeovirgaceae bacterium]|nr:Hsp33 family molecular chaperone HslO [Flammeovirgaceae bacterium]
GFELRIFFHVTHFDESKIQYHCPCSKYFTIILLSENFLKAISLVGYQGIGLFFDPLSKRV